MDASNMLKPALVARRAPRHRRDDDQGISEIHRERPGSDAPLPAGLRAMSLDRGRHRHPARAQGEIRALSTACASPTTPSSPRSIWPAATSPTDSCRTKSSTSSTKRHLPCASRLRTCRRSSKRPPQDHAPRDRARGLEEGDRAKRRKPEWPKIEKEIADLKETTSELELKWKNEKETITDIKRIKKELEALRIEARRRRSPRRSRQGRRDPLRQDSGSGKGARQQEQAPEETADIAPHLEGRDHRRGYRRRRLALDRHPGLAHAGIRSRETDPHGRRARRSASSARTKRSERSPTRSARSRAGIADPESSDRLVHIPRPDRRGQDRAHQSSGGIPVQ